MKHELECPSCGKNIELDEDYLSGDCECGRADYYWYSVYDEETGEEFFEGYYWNVVPIDEWRNRQLKDILCKKYD